MIRTLSTFLLGKQFLGIEHFSLNGINSAAAVVVKQSEGELEITSKELIQQTLLPKQWDSKLPAYLVLNTGQVIQKDILESDSTDEKLLHKSFPNLNWKDFYYEVWRYKGRSVVSICRKDFCDRIISEYKGKGILISGVTLGVCAVSALTKYTDDPLFSTNQQNISLNERDSPIISTGNLHISSHIINGLEIPNTYLLAFSSVLHLMIENRNTSGNIKLLNDSLRERYRQARFFTKGIKIAIGFLLSILFINSLLFTHYFNQSQETTQTLLANRTAIETASTIKQRIQVKEEKLNSKGGHNSQRATLILNTIALKVPPSIVLTSLTFNPLTQKVKSEQKITVSENIVLISGTTIDNAAFTNWIEEINNLESTKNVVIKNFGENDLQETAFALTITLKYNEAEPEK